MAVLSHRTANPMLLLLAVVSLVAVAAASPRIPHSPGNSVIAENLDLDVRTFIDLHEYVKLTSAHFRTFRNDAEAAVLQLVDLFDDGTGDVPTLCVQVRDIVNQLLGQLEKLLRSRNYNLNQLLIIGEEMVDTNLNEALDEPGVSEALDELMHLRETKDGKLDEQLLDLRTECVAVTERRLQEALTVAPCELRVVFLRLLDDVGATVRVNQAREHIGMAAVEHRFSELTLKLSLDEKRALDAHN